MRIIVDAMGGDNAPEEIVIGALEGAKEYGADITFCGDREKIERIMKEHGYPEASAEIYHTADAIDMHEEPISILKSKKNSSMAICLSLLRDGAGDAVLSAGSTGALILGSSSRIYKLKGEGVKRCAIATVLPFTNPTLLIDSGANIEVTPEELCQFAKMGSIYMQGIFDIENPRIGLCNNGAEETKGTALYVETNKFLSKTEGINFIGNVEGRDIPLGACDVVVCDGFTGNVILKLSEGFGKFLSAELKKVFTQNVKTKAGYLLIKDSFGKFRESLSFEKYGGAPLLGTVKPVIKAHGASKRDAIKSAVLQAKKYAESGIGSRIENEMKKAMDHAESI